MSEGWSAYCRERECVCVCVAYADRRRDTRGRVGYIGLLRGAEVGVLWFGGGLIGC